VDVHEAVHGDFKPTMVTGGFCPFLGGFSYEQLAKQGKLEKALEKKRKRNAAKDRRWLPQKRRVVEEP